MASKGFVYFCPELRLYRYAESGGDAETDYKFDADELEDAIVASLAAAEEKEGEEAAKHAASAKLLATMTAYARLHPHKIVQFELGADKIKHEISEPSEFWKKHDAERDAAEGGR